MDDSSHLLQTASFQNDIRKRRGPYNHRNGPGLVSRPYLGLLPAGEVDVVAEEVSHALLRHLTLQRLQQVCKPLEGLCLRAQPVEVDLRKTPAA